MRRKKRWRKMQKDEKQLTHIRSWTMLELPSVQAMCIAVQ